MKKKTTSAIAIVTCLVLLLSVFSACKNKNDSQNPTEISPDESWYPGVDSTYEPVTIGTVELADIVKEALGDEAKDFNGDLSSLTAEQLKKVEALAEQKGYTIEKNEQGNPVVKDPSYAEASYEEKKKVLEEASVADLNNVSAEDKKKLEEAAEKNGMKLFSNNDGSVSIVKHQMQNNLNGLTNYNGNNNNNNQGKANSNGDTALTSNPNYVAPMGTTLVRTKTANCSWKATYSSKSNDTFVNNALAEDGVVCVGVSFKSDDAETAATNVALISKFDKDGKEMWHVNEGKSDVTNFENVSVLSDGSIVAVGYTKSSDIAPASEYKCQNTVEGIVVKYSKNGKREWLKIIGGSKSDMIYSVAATPDGGFVIGGKTTSEDGDFKDITSNKISSFIFKYDEDGNVLWKKAFSGTMHSATDEIAVASSGYIYATISVYAATGDYSLVEGLKEKGKSTAVVKYAPDGTLVWIKGFKGAGSTELTSIAVTNDGGCIVAGQYCTASDGTNSDLFNGFHNGGMPGTMDGAVLKIAPNGKTEWLTTLIGYESDYITGVTCIPGGYAVSGYTTSSNRDFLSNSGNYDSYVYILSEYGEKQTVTSFGGGNSDTARGICGDGTKTVYLCGISNSDDGYFADCSNKGNENCAIAYLFRYDLDQGETK